MSNPDRSWMYRRLDGSGNVTREYVEGLKEFVSYAKSRKEHLIEGRIRCPCASSTNRFAKKPRVGCNNDKFVWEDELYNHLYKHGFKPNYEVWVSHGESWVDEPQRHNTFEQSAHPSAADQLGQSMDVDGHVPNVIDMVMDAAGPDFVWDPMVSTTEKPTKVVQEWLDILNAAREPVSECSKPSVLEAAAECLNIKTEGNMSERTYNQFMDFIQKLLPEKNKMAKSWDDTCKIVKKIGLGFQLIDACINDCQLYRNGTANDMKCSICNHDRYKPSKSRGNAKRRCKLIPYKQLRYLPLTPRLQRLYTFKGTATDMKWHKTCPREEGVLSHPSDGEAWKNFDETYPNFAADPRNIRLCLSSDGFNPFGGSAKAYSCWPVIVTPLNLPPWLCMNEEYMFLTLLVPGPKGPGKNIDIYLQPLIEELQSLWDIGVATWDASTKQNFQMKAALMWTINDFPAYGYLSGWSTHGNLSCPYCMELTKAFRLVEGKKPCFFDCHRQFLPEKHKFRDSSEHFTKGRVERDEAPPRLSGDEITQRLSNLGPDKWGATNSTFNHPGFGEIHNWKKRSIFWDLPYWKTNLLRHNLDLMHIEKNIFDNIFNTVMDMGKKSKDNPNARVDMKKLCSRRGLELIPDGKGKYIKPKARYTMSRDEKMKILKWVKTLRLPDGYASNLARCANLETCTMQGMKSHDCHVFLERLLPIAFRDLLPDYILAPLAELSEFFKVICSSVLREEDLKLLEKNIVVTLCKLEKIFPPAFFDSMEHLPVHLAYEARVGGPVQYRWMYPFERFLNTLKRKVKNKARVEGSIVKGYLMREASYFCSYYLDDEVSTKLTTVGRNYDGGELEQNKDISVFKHPGRFLGNPIKEKKQIKMTESEFHIARTYVLLNCEEVTENYIPLFEAYVRRIEPDISPKLLEAKKDKDFYRWFRRHIEENPDDEVRFPGITHLAEGPCLLDVQRYNGYFVNGYAFHTEEYGGTRATMNSGVFVKGLDVDYYGKLLEVIQLGYSGGRKVVLFNCRWFDPTVGKGIKPNAMCDIVDVNSKLKYRGKDTYVLASQAHQCYITEYPYRKQGHGHWLAVFKTKARGRIDVPYKENVPSENNESLSDAFYQEPVMPRITPVTDGGADLDNPILHTGSIDGEETYVDLEEESAEEERGEDEEEDDDDDAQEVVDVNNDCEEDDNESDSDDEESLVH